MIETADTWRFADHIALLGSREDVSARAALDDLFFRAVSRAAAPYPEIWFDGFRKDADTYHRLARILQSTAEIEAFSWFPFRGRVPYAAWLADRAADRVVRWFTFRDRRYALLKRQLKRDYRDNLLAYPELHARASLWRRVGALLRVYGEPEGQTETGVTLWALAEARPDVKGSPHGEETLGEALVAELARRGRATRVTLVDALRAHASMGLPPPEDTTRDAASAAVRRVVLEQWEQLSPDEQVILGEAAAGVPAMEMRRRHPRLANAVAVSRAIASINERFVQAIATELGRGPGGAAHPAATPRAVALALHDVVEDRTSGTWREVARTRTSVPPEPTDPDGWEAFQRLWDALRDAGRSLRAGLGGSIVAGVAEVGWEADPARALADAEIDEGWTESGDEPGPFRE